MVEARGLPWRMTLYHSHVIFQIDHPEEQEVSGIREEVEAGRLVLDPLRPGHVCGTWIDAGWVRHCHARSAVPANPRNVAAVGADGRPGRGIQYPFVDPGPGVRSEEHTSELQSLMRISYAVFCLKTKIDLTYKITS